MNKKNIINIIDIRQETNKYVLTCPDIKIINKDIISNEFQNIILEFEDYLKNTYSLFKTHEEVSKTKEQLTLYLSEQSKKLFKELDRYFYKIFHIMEKCDNKHIKIYQKYLQSHVLRFFVNSPINNHIFYKPLGYPGDYELMNLIYDHSNDFMGRNLFDKAINYYTGNIPITKSNIDRLLYFKDKLREIDENKVVGRLKIASIGCGPAREILEFIEEDVNNNIEFSLIDFEEKAFEYIQNGVALKDKRKLKKIKLDCQLIDVINMIKGNVKGADYQLIYSSGLFDYLKDKVASKLIEKLFSMLCQKGRLIIVNANSEDAYHRAYYEALGEWHFFHRTKQDMLNWLAPIEAYTKKIYFDSIPNNGYHFMVIEKK